MAKKNFLRIPDVMTQTGLAKSTIWLWVKQGKLPAPIKLSSRVTVWEQSELDNWMDSKIGGDF